MYQWGSDKAKCGRPRFPTNESEWSWPLERPQILASCYWTSLQTSQGLRGISVSGASLYRPIQKLCSESHQSPISSLPVFFWSNCSHPILGPLAGPQSSSPPTATSLLQPRSDTGLTYQYRNIRVVEHDKTPHHHTLAVMITRLM